jgi:uncharacterized protein YutE (UPF0331/DUF86 family)
MTIDRERIFEKVAYIRRQLVDIRALTKDKTRAEILDDQWLVKGLKYSLQTSIEALIDIAYHLSAKQFNHAPADARDALQFLVSKEILLPGDFEIYSAMVGFRNRVVHGYQQVSDQRVYEISTKEISSFESFIDQILCYLQN